MTFLDLVEITKEAEVRYIWYLKGSVYTHNVADPASTYCSSYYKTKYAEVTAFLDKNFDNFQVNKILFIYDTTYYTMCLIKSKNGIYKVVRMSNGMYRKIMKDFAI